MERDFRNDNMERTGINDEMNERLEGLAASEMADRGPKDVLQTGSLRSETDINHVNGHYIPDEDDDIEDEEEDDLILGDEDALDDEDLNEEDIDVEIDDDMDDVDEDDLVLGDDDDDLLADDEEDEEDDTI